ncbi:hypothetical protein Rpal_0663 [Rhodopseudomonas palustris TIE-1]|uniref:hypothetical protein n=1 Tax=Rhodopseudomonas palustris TaxID=1076 RepID=UPI000164AC86|nr:hypothetical protein [Rhodopseudomonas palustris]ACE99222.1 hypothetical protein Rpal_0663 [Rhodopseudomonas palustris TIE-1]
MDVFPLIMAFVGIIVAVITAIIIAIRARWVRDTYGPDFGIVDKVDAVMTPELWVAASIAIVLILVGAGTP